MTVYKWSQTAASNSNADSTINWAEGQAPSSVNNSARALMAAVAKYRDDLAGKITTGGTSTAYTVTTNQSFASASAMDGAVIAFRPHATCGADPTLAVDGLTARQIVTSSGTNVGAGQLVAGRIYVVTYVNSSTEFRLHSAYPISISGLTAETALATADIFPFYDDSAADNRKVTVPNLFKAISVLDAETSPATDDQVLISDTSDSAAANRMTLANLLKVINSLTEDTSPDRAADFLITYDTSASAVKKVAPNNMLRVLQVLQTTYATNADLTTVIPYDDTTPTSSEGTEILSQAITPADNSNKVLCQVSVWGSQNTNGSRMIAALFRGTTCLQVAAHRFPGGADFPAGITFSYLDSPASASEQTYTVRVGPDANTVRLNGTTISRLFGGTATYTLTLSEIVA